jgi:hypothetical protein
MSIETEGILTEEKKFDRKTLFYLFNKNFGECIKNVHGIPFIEEHYNDELRKAIQVFFIDIGYRKKTEIILPEEKQKMADEMFEYFSQAKNKRPSLNEYFGKRIQKTLDFIN